MKIRAIDESIDIIELIVNTTVSELENDSNCYLIAERLSNIMNLLNSALTNVFESTKKTEVKELSAILLLNMGSLKVIDYLIKMIEEGGVHSGIAARDLSKRGIEQVIDPLINKLSKTQFEDIDLVVTMIQALKTLNTPLPDNLVSKFKSAGTPWQIRSLVE